MRDEVIRLDAYRERVEVDTGPTKPMIGRGLKTVHIVALSQREGKAWAQRNKAGCASKVHHADSEHSMKGLYLKDEPVFVLNPLSQSVRENWLMTGAKLVYL